jgi:lysophospholipase L1-like esterase
MDFQTVRVDTMKKTLGTLCLLVCLAGGLRADAQITMGAQQYTGGNWVALQSTSTSNPLANVQPVRLYCYSSGVSAWVPADSSCFSGGGTTTNPLTAAARGGAAPGTTFNGSAPVTFDYHSVGAVSAASGVVTGYGMPNWLAALNNVRVGTGDAVVCDVGDSTHYGYPYGFTAAPLVIALGDMTTMGGLRTSYDSWFGTGANPANSFLTSDSRITAGSWAQDLTINSIGWGTAKITTTGGSPLAFTPTGQVNSFTIYYIVQPSGGTLTANIDGGTASTASTAGTAGIGQLTLTTTLGTHTLNVNMSAGTQVNIIGEAGNDTTHSKVRAMLAAGNSESSAQMANQTAAYGGGFPAIYTALGCQLVIAEDGPNDWNQGVPVNTFSTNLQTLITAVKAAQSDMLLNSAVPTNPTVDGISNATQSTYVEAMRVLSLNNTNPTLTAVPLPFTDTFDQWQSYAISNAVLWYQPDGIHPNTTGYQVNGDKLYGDLAIYPTQESSLSAKALTTFGGQIITGTPNLVAPYLPVLGVETTGATAPSRSTNGTMFSVNAPSGFTGVLAGFYVNGTQFLAINANGLLNAATGYQSGSGSAGTVLNTSGLRVANNLFIGFAASGTQRTSMCEGGAAGVFAFESAATCTNTVAGATGTVAAAVFVSSGATAGFAAMTQGSTSAAVAPCNTANTICWQAPTSVTSQLRVLAGTPATGFPLYTNSSGTMTETIRGAEGTISTGPALFGSSAINTVVAQTIAAYAGHFTNLVITSSLGGACTTSPTFNVFDGTTNTGTAKLATSTTQTKGTTTNQTQTLTFAAGDLIGIYISTAGATCTTDTWVVSAEYSEP